MEVACGSGLWSCALCHCGVSPCDHFFEGLGSADVEEEGCANDEEGYSTDHDSGNDTSGKGMRVIVVTGSTRRCSSSCGWLRM